MNFLAGSNYALMIDERNRKLAEVFLDHSLEVSKGDKLVIMTSDTYPLDLIQECYKGALQRGALVYLDILGFNLLLNRTSVGDLPKIFFEYAKGEQLDTVPMPYDAITRWGEKFLRITTLDNYNALAKSDSKKIQRRMKAFDELFQKMVRKKWVLTYYPTIGLAQDAQMSLEGLTDFYYESCLPDYKKMEKSLIGLSRYIDAGKQVHIKGYRTDLKLGIDGRKACPCFGKFNVPDGETFTGPEEEKTNGHIYYDFPTRYSGKIISGIYLEFKLGKVVKFSAESNQDVLKTILETDPGAKRFGELAFGMNYNIKNFMQNTLFDEKIGGTMHTALGRSYTDRKGLGKNVSAIHWDIVKDTRKKGSEVWIDDKLVLKEGKILV